MLASIATSVAYLLLCRTKQVTDGTMIVVSAGFTLAGITDAVVAASGSNVILPTLLAAHSVPCNIPTGVVNEIVNLLVATYITFNWYFDGSISVHGTVPPKTPVTPVFAALSCGGLLLILRSFLATLKASSARATLAADVAVRVADRLADYDTDAVSQLLVD